MEILSAASPEFREYGRIVAGCEEITAATVTLAKDSADRVETVTLCVD